jgi:hypothetical protein
MTLYELQKILRNWPAFLEAVEPHVAAAILEEWPNPPSFDVALAAIIGPPGSKACAAFAEALAALDRREAAKEDGDVATAPAKAKPAPTRAPAATLTDEPKTDEPVPPVLYGEVIPPNAGARCEGNKTTSSRDEVSSNGSATSNPQPVGKRARALVREHGA